jgi:hypothetical protein
MASRTFKDGSYMEVVSGVLRIWDADKNLLLESVVSGWGEDFFTGEETGELSEQDRMALAAAVLYYDGSRWLTVKNQPDPYKLGPWLLSLLNFERPSVPEDVLEWAGEHLEELGRVRSYFPTATATDE